MLPKHVSARILAGMIVTVIMGCFATAAWAGDKGPAVGSLAPELGKRNWLQKEKKVPREISELRGKVVLVQTFAYYCDP